MAEIPARSTPIGRHTVRIVWEGLTVGDWGSWDGSSQYPDKTVHISGTFAGATVTIEGTNELSAAPQPLADAFGVQLSGIASPTVRTITDNPQWIRPMLVGGSGTTSITIRVVANRAAR